MNTINQYSVIFKNSDFSFFSFTFQTTFMHLFANLMSLSYSLLFSLIILVLSPEMNQHRMLYVYLSIELLFIFLKHYSTIMFISSFVLICFRVLFENAFFFNSLIFRWWWYFVWMPYVYISVHLYIVRGNWDKYLCPYILIVLKCMVYGCFLNELVVLCIEFVMF